MNASAIPVSKQGHIGIIIRCQQVNAGQAMVEYIIILPILLLLIMGILQFSFIYQTKITLNYAAFETARAGSLNNAKITAMQDAFASAMAPLYSNNNSANDFIQARQRVRSQITDGYVGITVINPSTASFSEFGINNDDGNLAIPNDNLMYRDATPLGGSQQALQDANLLKVHIGYCYELYVPFVNRILWLMQRYAPGGAAPAQAQFGRRWVKPDVTDPGFFGPPTVGSFAQTCITNPTKAGRLSIVLHSQGIIRMQSPAIQCEITDSC